MKKSLNMKIFVASALALLNMPVAAQTRYYDNIVVRQNGAVVYQNKATNIDSIAMENNKTQLALYDKDGGLLFSTTAQGTRMDVEQGAPVADMLDLVFNEDGSATDISDMGNTVKSNTGGVPTYYSPTFHRYVARFSNTWAGATSNYYRIDYGSNKDFIDLLKDGHTLEAVVMANYEEPIKNGEAKFFSSHEAGGTGLMVCKTSGSRGNELTFLPNVSTTGKSTWRWANSGIVPVPKKYYHVVGVWDKDEKVAKIYVDGVLKNTVNADGELVLPKANSQWFGVGCDSGPSAQLGWCGDVVLARVYDAVLTDNDVEQLWEDVKRYENNAGTTLVENVQYCDGLAVKPGSTYQLFGTGFKEGDKLRMQLKYNASKTFDMPCVLTSMGIALQMPEGIESGSYRLTVVRGEQTQLIGLTKVVVMDQIPTGAQVVAHRGAWNDTDASQNSRAAFQKALAMNVYGSETDVWSTTDGHLVINHDPTIGGINIETSTYDQIKDIKLKNGETLPQLQDLLDILKASTSPTKMVLEMKEHSTDARNEEVAKAIVEAVKAAGVQDKVEYISFSLAGCKAFAKAATGTRVAYLKGGIAPAELQKNGITGLDYHIAEFRNHPEWVKQAQDLGMSTNVWTVDALKDMAEMTNLGIGFISTNKPQEALVIKAYYDEASKSN